MIAAPRARRRAGRDRHPQPDHVRARCREIIASHGGTPVRTRVGHSFIKAKMAETNAIFGGEHSGHFYFRDFWFADSGMLAALHTLAALGHDDRPLSVILSEFSRYAASGEINSEVEDQAAATAKVKNLLWGTSRGYSRRARRSHGRGAGTWWFNLRPSNTEPLLRLKRGGGRRGRDGRPQG